MENWVQLEEQYYCKSSILHTENQKLLKSGGVELGEFCYATVHKNVVSVCLYDNRRLIRQVEIDYTARIVQLQWLSRDRLLVATEDYGLVVNVMDVDDKMTKFSLDHAGKVIECRSSGSNNLVVLMSDFKFILISDCVTQSHNQRIVECQLYGEPPYCWTLFDQQSIVVSTRESVQIVVGSSGSLGSGHAIQNRSMKIEGKCNVVICCCVSPDRKLIAMADVDGRILVANSTLTQILMQFDSKIDAVPQQFAWCGNDSVLTYWPSTDANDPDGVMLMVSPNSEWVKFTYQGAIILQTQVDGCRVFHQDGVDFLERVDDSLVNALKLGSVHPAALLYDAYQNFERKDCKSYDIVIGIKDDLLLAIDTLLEAVLHCRDTPAQQKQLLRAVNFGRCFSDPLMYGGQQVSVTLRTRRLLNQLKTETGVFMTSLQFQKFGLDQLLNMLTQMNMHKLAYNIATFWYSQEVSTKVQPILNHWIRVQIADTKEHLTDDQLLAMVERHRNVSFADLAQVSYQVGRAALAQMLLDKEPHIGKQVPLLIVMQQYEIALSKAVKSGDSDLIYAVLFQVRRNLSLPQFMQLVGKSQQASALYETYLRKTNTKALHDFYQQSDRKLDNALLYHVVAGQCANVEGRLELFKKSHDILAGSKEAAFVAALKNVDDHARLLAMQVRLQQELNLQFIDKSLTQTVYELILQGHEKHAHRMKNDLRLPDTDYWYLKVRALVQRQDFDELWKFAKSRKSPIGYQTFAKQCYEAGDMLETKKYVHMCDARDRPGLFLSFKMIREAIDTAVVQRDVDVLLRLKEEVKNTTVVAEADKALKQLGF